MKISALVFLTCLSVSTFATAKPVLKCAVPSEDAKKVTVVVDVGNDISVDFIRLTLVEGEKTIGYFSQIEKGEFSSQMSAGVMGLLLVSETSRQENGVVRNAGFIGIRKEGNKLNGFISVQSNVYPLECTAVNGTEI
ncbi:MAG: hypothetical protein AABY64_01070 [Bdellovibrionota bacterium]